MLVTLSKDTFNTLDDRELILVCIKPTILQIRGKSYAFKSAFSSSLTKGQRALVMFEVLYGHAVNGVIEFFQNFSYLVENQGFWTVLKQGASLFGDVPLFDFVSKLENLYRDFLSAASSPNGCNSDILNTALLLDDEIKLVLADAIGPIGCYIRNHTDEFLQIKS